LILKSVAKEKSLSGSRLSIEYEDEKLNIFSEMSSLIGEETLKMLKACQKCDTSLILGQIEKTEEHYKKLKAILDKFATLF